MRGHKGSKIFDLALIAMAYLIFAISLLGVNMVKYQGIRIGFYVVLITSFILLYYSVYSFNRDLEKSAI